MALFWNIYFILLLLFISISKIGLYHNFFTQKVESKLFFVVVKRHWKEEKKGKHKSITNIVFTHFGRLSDYIVYGWDNV